MSNWEIVQALVFEPRKAFLEIAERPKYWFPLLVLIIATGGILYWYISVADPGWVTDRQLRHGFFASRVTEEMIADRVKMAQEHQTLSAVSTTLGVVIFLPVGMMIPALYNLLVGKMVGFERGFRQWYSFTCWAALPGALSAIPAALVLLTTDTTQFGQEALKTLSLNSLLFHRTIDEPGFSFLSSIDLFQMATLYLSLVGVKAWSGRSWLFTSLFVGLPWVLIYGIWALFSLR